MRNGTSVGKALAFDMHVDACDICYMNSCDLLCVDAHVLDNALR